MRIKLITIFLILLLAPALKAAEASLSVSTPSFPLTVEVGQDISVFVQVSNAPGVNGALNVVPSVLPVYPLGNGGVVQSSGPQPAAADIAAGSTQNFTYIFSSTACGSVQFSGAASGQDEVTGNPVSASTSDSNVVQINCVTPTPTPTQEVELVTPTPLPIEATAGLRANVFRPSSGQPVMLDYSLAHGSQVVIRIFDRNGRLVKSINRDVGPGRYSEAWDGRGDNGSAVASGIYIVHFRGKGLNVKGKLAVVR